MINNKVQYNQAYFCQSRFNGNSIVKKMLKNIYLILRILKLCF